ncbi:MAG: amidohydrolase family protein [Methanomassiliicoccales archaeon]|nr:amidohydrolase family protein [Methanomassiliicoccales archaeon]
MKTVLIKGGTVVTQNAKREVLQGDVLIEDGRIAQVGKVRGSADEVIDAAGDVVMPGLVNAHTHVAMTLMKGIADDMPFGDFLDRVFAADAHREERDLELGTKLGCLEMIRSGTTTFVDMYYSEDVIAKAVEQAGLRGVLCWAVLDQRFTTQKGVPLDNCKRFFHSHRGREKVIPGIGLQGVYVCSEETFMASREFALEKGLLLHFHLSETRKEVYDHKASTGRRPAEWLERIGFLGRQCLAAHSAWLTINEVRALARAGASIASCPVSNMKLATGGVAPIPEMLAEGVNVSLGTDGSTTNNSLDMFGEMKTLSLLQKCSRWDPTVAKAQQVLDFATVNGAKAIGLGHELGSIEAGKRADVIILDGKSPNLRPLLPGNVVSNVVYSANAGNVRTSICGGQVLMRDRQVLTLHEGEVLMAAESTALELLARR